MRSAYVVSGVLLLTGGLLGAGSPAPVGLRPGERTTLHIGQIATLRPGSAHSYTVTLEGDAVVRLPEQVQSGKLYSYRAVHAGNATLLMTPTDRKAGECVDCVTRHCFLTVVP
jgi:hypothetical protein